MKIYLYKRFKKCGVFSTFIVISMMALECHAKEVFSANNENSQVSFAGEHAGMRFDGIFEKWQADLRLPPADNAAINATFDLSNAKTGDFTYDSTLPEGDWFDVENHPKGQFVSESIETSTNGYRVTGVLTLRGISRTQSFELIKKEGGLRAEFSIDRLDYSIGVESDPEAEWVSRNILMGLDINY